MHTCLHVPTLFSLSFAPTASPSVTYSFGLNDRDKNESKQIDVQFNRAQLKQFFNQLETIQTQLDGLG